MPAAAVAPLLAVLALSGCWQHADAAASAATEVEAAGELTSQILAMQQV